MSLSLEQLQAQFSVALLDDASPLPFPDAFIDSGEGLAARISLYRRSLFNTWSRTLAAAYPVVHALIGPECFTDVARAYGQSCPSASGDLNEFGAGFAKFVDVCPVTFALAYIGDVAALEWAVHRAHFAADVIPLRRERIAALTPDQLLSSRFSVHPACSWVTSAHAICSIWLAHQSDGNIKLSTIAPRPEYAIVTRKRWRISVRHVTYADVIALESLRAGADMDAMIAAALRADPAFDFGKALVRWLDDEVLTSVEGLPEL